MVRVPVLKKFGSFTVLLTEKFETEIGENYGFVGHVVESVQLKTRGTNINDRQYLIGGSVEVE